MTSESVLEAAPAVDRRVRRTRAALLNAAIALVSERGTAAVPVSDLAEAADVSRRVMYEHFGDRDTLLLEAALDLARRELLAAIADPSHELTGRARALAVARHFAGHRTFYRALMTGPCAFALDRGLLRLILPLNQETIQRGAGDRLDPQTAADLATCLTGAGAALITTWVVEGADPLDPEAFTDRLLRVTSVLATALGVPTNATIAADPEDRS